MFGSDFLTHERMPEEWRRRALLLLLFKNRCDFKSFRKYVGLKEMSRTMKLWEKVTETRLRREVMISEQQYGFILRKIFTYVVLALSSS